tara:strand:- start:655 stop:1170 length:516 start_codon:yes stop_codon:yes gene_type:complete
MKAQVDCFEDKMPNIFIDEFLDTKSKIEFQNKSIDRYKSIILILESKNRKLKRTLNRFNSPFYSFLNTFVAYASSIYRMNLSLLRLYFKNSDFNFEKYKPNFVNFEMLYLTLFWTFMWLVKTIYSGNINVYVDFLLDVYSFSIGLSLLYLAKIISGLFVNYRSSEIKNVYD